jgi:hypothetical protein
MILPRLHPCVVKCVIPPKFASFSTYLYKISHMEWLLKECLEPTESTALNMAQMLAKAIVNHIKHFFL